MQLTMTRPAKRGIALENCCSEQNWVRHLQYTVFQSSAMQPNLPPMDMWKFVSSLLLLLLAAAAALGSTNFLDATCDFLDVPNLICHSISLDTYFFFTFNIWIGILNIMRTSENATCVIFWDMSCPSNPTGVSSTLIPTFFSSSTPAVSVPNGTSVLLPTCRDDLF